MNSPVIDGHVHCGRWHPDRIGWPGATPDDIRDALDRSGIDQAVLLPTDTADNEGLADIVEADTEGRFHLFPWATPHDPGPCLDFLERRADVVSGLKFHPSLERVRVDDPLWRPFLEYAERRRLPVVIHAGRWQEMSSWKICLTVAERHPEAAIITAHMGGDTPDLQQDCSREMAERKLPNAYLGTESIREYYSLRIALDRLGPERILFGSDYPLGWPAAYLAVLDGAKPTPEERRLVLGENMLRLIGRRRA